MRWNGMQGNYYDFKDGDVLSWRERKLGTLTHHKTDEADWWDITLTDDAEHNLFVGYGKDLTQEQLDMIANIFWRGLTIGLTFNRKMEETAFGSIPCSM